MPTRDGRAHRARFVAWFSSEVGAPRRRRPTDVVLLVGCLLLLLLLGLSAPGPTSVDAGLVTVVQSLPTVVEWVVAAGYAAAALWGLLLLVVALVRPGRRGLAGELVIAAAGAFGLAGLTGILAGTGWDRSWSAMWTSSPPPVYTAVRVAVVTAVIVTASPHLSYPVRAVGRWLLAVVAVGAVVVGVAYPIGAASGWVVGLGTAAIVHLLFGSPGGRPSPARVQEALADLGLDVEDVRDRPSFSGGVSAYESRLADGRTVSVAVLGRDEWNANAVASLWNAATTRGARVTLGRSRREQAEHTAMLGLLAERAGVNTPSVVAAGRSARGDALLVAESPSASMEELPAGQLTDELLIEAWTQLARFHDAGIAHGRLSPSCLVLDAAGRVSLADLSAATLGAEDRTMRIDDARLLVAAALLTDVDRAVAQASGALGSDGLAAVLPFLQPAVLDGPTRRLVAAADWDLEGLRGAVVSATGVEPPPLEQIRRVTRGAIVRVALIGLLTYFLISTLSGVDFASLWAELSTANWWWIAAGFVLSPLAQVFFSFGTIGATTTRLRYLAVLMLQYAVQFLALIVPSTAARIALDVRFFQSFGVAPGAAVSLGMIDSFSGFVVQILLIIVILVSGLPAFTSPIGQSSTTGSSTDTTSSPSVAALALAIGLLSIVVVLVVPRLRRRFLGRARHIGAAVREQLRSARGALDVLRRPSKLGEMLGGNLGGQVVQAVVLGLCLKAFGAEASLSQLILINTAVSLFAGLMPVPGGMGVAEAGYTAGLQAIGVPSSVAISTAIAFRLVTFYLPPLWGSVAMRWLRRNSYV